MMLESFKDELTKLGTAGSFQLSGVTLGTRAPLNSIGVLVRRALTKRAYDLSIMHNELAPPAIELSPNDASTRLHDGSRAPSLVRPGQLGAVTPSADPIDRERFNRVWSQPAR
jgi:hypothetical protein